MTEYNKELQCWELVPNAGCTLNENKDGCLLGCCTVQSGRSLPTFQEVLVASIIRAASSSSFPKIGPTPRQLIKSTGHISPIFSGFE
jgi:hypothetical protein